MKTCLIMTGGCVDLNFAGDYLSGRSYDLIIAADAGLEALKALGLSPDEIVGDLDTVDPFVLKEYAENPHILLKVHRPEKDETDTELALLTAAGHGCTEIDLLGALGGRMDHALGNLQLLYRFFKGGMNVRIYDEKNKIYLLDKKQTFHRKDLYGKYISFLPLTEKVEKITLCGFRYPLKEKDIRLGTSLCISNELIEESGTMDLEAGTLICVESHD